MYLEIDQLLLEFLSSLLIINKMHLPLSEMNHLLQSLLYNSSLKQKLGGGNRVISKDDWDGYIYMTPWFKKMAFVRKPKELKNIKKHIDHS
jgi:hypothetical protein